MAMKVDWYAILEIEKKKKKTSLTSSPSLSHSSLQEIDFPNHRWRKHLRLSFNFTMHFYVYALTYLLHIALKFIILINCLLKIGSQRTCLAKDSLF